MGSFSQTLDAHRLIHYTQENGPKGANVKVLDSLYHSYFEEGQPPAAIETLLNAAKAGGLDETAVKQYLESSADRITIKNKIRRVNGEIDGVPYIIICGSAVLVRLTVGRKRDFTIEGAVEEEKYLKTFIQVAKEFN
jgi:predicted DsbA family dithiol-disulfide isomerase